MKKLKISFFFCRYFGRFNPIILGRLKKKKQYIAYQGRKVGFFRPSVEYVEVYAVQVEGEKTQAEGEYYNPTRLKSPLSPWCTPYFL